MRLWTLHPRHLDQRGLVAVWREGLLAKAVLRGRTRGYRSHPQLARFRAHPNPVAAINVYLAAVSAEARRRGYRFDARRLRGARTTHRIRATDGQLRFEWAHLRRKFRMRAPDVYRLTRGAQPSVHPLFQLTSGPIAPWEARGASGAKWPEPINVRPRRTVAVKLNAKWHAAHPMPPRATLEQRLGWHQQHAKHCACRPIPAGVRKAMRQRQVRAPRRGRGSGA